MIYDDFFSYLDLVKALKKSGIKKDYSVFLTTNIALMGQPASKNKNKLKTKSHWVLKAIKEIIGKKGNIFVPTYSYTFQTKQKKIFRPKNTRSEIGYFPNFFLKKKVIRSLDPMVSVSGQGPNVKNILIGASNTSYGKNCVFERLLKIKNLKCISIGLGINWIPFIHYLDWINKAPFRYDKYFRGYIQINKKLKSLVKWHYPVRYLNNKSSISNGYKLGSLAYKNKMFKESYVGRGKIYNIDYKKYFNFCMKSSKKNKWITANGNKS